MKMAVTYLILVFTGTVKERNACKAFFKLKKEYWMCVFCFIFILQDGNQSRSLQFIV